MPKGTNRLSSVRSIAAAALLVASACAPIPFPNGPAAAPQLVLAAAQVDDLGRLASDLNPAAPGTQILPGSGNCGRAGMAATSVIRGVFPERVLFATASDQPAASADGVLNLLAERLLRDAPRSELTVLGHTDSQGSDAYNIDLSRRRAAAVLHGLVARGLNPNRLSAVAIGKRQPLAGNDTAEGRARNRRVEFLVSGCLAANLDTVRGQISSVGDAGTPVQVLRLDPLNSYGLIRAGTVSLQSLHGGEAAPATLAPAASVQRSALPPAVGVARPAPAPHFQPKTLSPDAQPSPLGPAVPF